MERFSLSRPNWRAERGRFIVVGGGNQIEMRLAAEGLKFVCLVACGEQAEIQLSWDGTMEFVKWVYHRRREADRRCLRRLA